MIEAEKDELDDRYDSMECGEDHWEAFQDGYAAALFTRLEIVPSELRLTSWAAPDDGACGDGERACEASDAAYAEHRSMLAEEFETLERILRMRRQ